MAKKDRRNRDSDHSRQDSFDSELDGIVDEFTSSIEAMNAEFDQNVKAVRSESEEAPLVDDEDDEETEGGSSLFGAVFGLLGKTVRWGIFAGVSVFALLGRGLMLPIRKAGALLRFGADDEDEEDVEFEAETVTNSSKSPKVDAAEMLAQYGEEEDEDESPARSKWFLRSGVAAAVLALAVSGYFCYKTFGAGSKSNGPIAAQDDTDTADADDKRVEPQAAPTVAPTVAPTAAPTAVPEGKKKPEVKPAEPPPKPQKGDTAPRIAATVTPAPPVAADKIDKNGDKKAKVPTLPVVASSSKPGEKAPDKNVAAPKPTPKKADSETSQKPPVTAKADPKSAKPPVVPPVTEAKSATAAKTPDKNAETKPPKSGVKSAIVPAAATAAVVAATAAESATAVTPKPALALPIKADSNTSIKPPVPATTPAKTVAATPPKPDPKNPAAPVAKADEKVSANTPAKAPAPPTGAATDKAVAAAPPKPDSKPAKAPAAVKDDARPAIASAVPAVAAAATPPKAAAKTDDPWAATSTATTPPAVSAPADPWAVTPPAAPTTSEADKKASAATKPADPWGVSSVEDSLKAASTQKSVPSTVPNAPEKPVPEKSAPAKPNESVASAAPVVAPPVVVPPKQKAETVAAAPASAKSTLPALAATPPPPVAEPAAKPAAAPTAPPAATPAVSSETLAHNAPLTPLPKRNEIPAKKIDEQAPAIPPTTPGSSVKAVAASPPATSSNREQGPGISDSSKKGSAVFGQVPTVPVLETAPPMDATPLPPMRETPKAETTPSISHAGNVAQVPVTTPLPKKPQISEPVPALPTGPEVSATFATPTPAASSPPATVAEPPRTSYTPPPFNDLGSNPVNDPVPKISDSARTEQGDRAFAPLVAAVPPAPSVAIPPEPAPMTAAPLAAAPLAAMAKHNEASPTIPVETAPPASVTPVTKMLPEHTELAKSETPLGSQLQNGVREIREQIPETPRIRFASSQETDAPSGAVRFTPREAQAAVTPLPMPSRADEATSLSGLLPTGKSMENAESNAALPALESAPASVLATVNPGYGRSVRSRSPAAATVDVATRTADRERRAQSFQQRLHSEIKTSPTETEQYVVQDGDTYMTICDRVYGTSLLFRALAEHNRRRFGIDYRPSPGTSIEIPPANFLQTNYSESLQPRRRRPQGRTGIGLDSSSYNGTRQGLPYVVQEGDTVFSIATDKLKDTSLWRNIMVLNSDRIADPRARLAAGTEIVLPVTTTAQTGTSRR